MNTPAVVRHFEVASPARIEAAGIACAGQVRVKPLSAVKALLLRAESWLRDYEEYVLAFVGASWLIGLAVWGFVG